MVFCDLTVSAWVVCYHVGLPVFGEIYSHNNNPFSAPPIIAMVADLCGVYAHGSGASAEATHDRTKSHDQLVM